MAPWGFSRRGSGRLESILDDESPTSLSLGWTLPMARRKTLPESLRAKLELAERLAALRLELFGERGGPEMARRLGIPVRTWYNYEGGVTVPAEVVLKIIELTAVEPGWLLHGKGSRFRPAVRPERSEAAPQSAVMVGALLRTALQLLEGEASTELDSTATRLLESERPAAGEAGGRTIAPRENTPRLGHDTLRADPGRGGREWLEARREGRCLTIPDDSMSPVLPRGTSVAFAPVSESPATLDGRMVVAWVDGLALVRWFEDRGDHGLLHAEDRNEPVRRVDLGPDVPSSPRRVLWIEAAR